MAQHSRNSPHNHHLQNGSAPPSPSMSNSQQGASRQPVSYPSPTSYPSPSLSSAQYHYPAPNNQQVSELYRASPTGSNSSLPSMHSLDALQAQHLQQHNMGSPLPPPVAQMGGGPYYHNQGQTLPQPPHHQYPNVTSDPAGQMRYALPVTDARVMSGGRHKKEIKRRTKTGCLTCRKRRIKCDEQHPACRNCQKSKRECMGYDPIFKQQPGPTAIQPAPSSAPSQSSIAATSNPYGNQPQMLQGGYGAPVNNMSYDPALSAGVSSPGSGSQQFDYTSAIDPALEAAAPPNATTQFTQPGMPNFREDLKRELQSASPYSSGASHSPHLRGGASSFVPPSSVASTEEDAAYTTSPAKQTINDLLALGGPAPNSSPTDVTQVPQKLEEIKHLFYSIYAPGLENFLETKWFSLKGLPKLITTTPLLDQFGTLIDQFAKTAPNDVKAITYTSSLEARVVWSLASMVHSSDANEIKIESKGAPHNEDPVEAGHRLTVFENLLTGKAATTNPLTKPVPRSADHHKSREMEFWYTLANFVCLQDDDPSSPKRVDDTLSALRNLLDGRENRDVLYSIAVVRALSPRISEYTDQNTPLHFDESDNRSKLLIAKKFIADEGHGAGTTNVIRRLCELASRSWNPTLGK
ncbi:hypothetical protein B7494_g3189 [Chlorociboria aeruginascens]|nr:hypothetical protein B7494_g3189 [Chlorociboria aeruginascens]